MEIRKVGGRRYNLDTAKKIGTAAETTLYRKNSGEFFLHWENTKKIESLIYRDAEKWAKKNLTEEEYKAGFTYSDTKRQVIYHLPDYAIQKLKNMAADRRKPMSEILTDIIMDADD